MQNWRDAILEHFVPHVSRLTLVADPDDLLTEELLAIELCQRGFDLIEFTDPVAFRYVYESNYRSRWDRDESSDVMLIVRVHAAELDRLPYDLLTQGWKLVFDLGSLLPSLSYSVLERLDRKYLDAIFEAQHTYAPGPMGENASKDFILRHVFGVVTELITTDVDLLRCLLRCHYNRFDMPESLCLRLAQILSRQRNFQYWPLAQIVPDSEAFFGFLQERWPIYLDTLRTEDQIKEQTGTYSLTYPGPNMLPFGHQDIGVYIDNLFLENRLSPVAIPIIPPEDVPWVKTGITADLHHHKAIQASRLLANIEESLPPQNARYSDWGHYALKWAELRALVHRREADHLSDGSFEQLASKINAVFKVWLLQHYVSLVNLPPIAPAMVHHVARHLARELEDDQHARIALIIVDGLALDQWITVRQILAEHDPSLVMRESTTFAWIPTLTSVSRQAIFAGKAPVYFSASIGGTDKEPGLWRQFWENVGLARSAIAYKKGLGDGNIAEILEDVFHPGRTRVLGLVLDKVDKIMHGMQLGAAGMHNQIQQWCSEGFLLSLINYLFDHHYQVWLTSDHGNIECIGQGRLSEGVIAEIRGERVRIYPTPELRDSVKENVSFGHAWPPIGLPNDYYPLLAESSSAFIKTDGITVAHGGASIEEVIVPFVRFERRKTPSPCGRGSG